MSLESRIDNPPVNDKLVTASDMPSPVFAEWLSLTQEVINSAFALLSAVESGEFTTVPGSASQTIPVSGAKADDRAMVIVKTLGTTPRFAIAASAAAGQINVTMNGDPGNDHVLTWQLIKN